MLDRTSVFSVKKPLLRTRGWWTVEPSEVAEVVEMHGRLNLGDKGELMVEFEDEKGLKIFHLLYQSSSVS